MSEQKIGQVANSPASRARADAIDTLLGPTRRYDAPAAEGLRQAWQECDLVISHLALGATTRLIAPLLADKATDYTPAGGTGFGVRLLVAYLQGLAGG